ncbi:MAG: insulinase family protein [Bacteroidetes bacterium]|nr:MAG: insulinase family protein [Bacteroidota bacterium]
MGFLPLPKPAGSRRLLKKINRMKQYFSTLCLLAATLLASAQEVDRTAPPKPGPAPVIKISDPETFTLPNGLKVYVVTNRKLPQVNATLTIDRDAISEGNKAGLINLSGQLMRSGTTKMNKAQLDEAIDFLGGSIASGSTFVGGNALTPNFAKLFALMADVALRPAMSATELEKLRVQTLSGLKQQLESPDAINSNVSAMLLYGKNHPYGEIETEASVKAVTVADVKKYYSTYWKPNIAYLVFVGDITVAQARALATQHFGTWARGNVPTSKHPAVLPPAKTYIAVVDRPTAVQSVINISTPVNMKPGAPDAIAASLTNTILGGGFSSRLNQNLREKYAFTYGANSSLQNDRLVGKFEASASVRTEKTDSAIGQFMYELKRIGTSAPGDSEVTSLKNYMSGGFARRLENPATIANYALNVARFNLPKDYYRNYLTTLYNTTPERIQSIGNQYISSQPMLITIVGNAKAMGDLSQYGEVKYFDAMGNPVAAPVVKKVDAGVSAESILKKAAAAVGTSAAVEAVKDITMTGTMEVMGQKVTYEQRNILPTGYSSKVLMGGMTLMSESKKGEQYAKSMQGQPGIIDAQGKDEMNLKASFFEEYHLLKTPGYKFELNGIEPVDGKDAYAIAITSPGGKSYTSFYDAVSGLKVQEVSQADGGPMGKLTQTTKYLEYKTVDGVQVPVKMLVDLGAFKQEITISSVKINQGLKEADL